jgi:acetaldehyde dehydrogenase
MAKKKAAIIGSGNIGTDLMIKIIRTSDHLEMGCFVGINPASDGLARAQRMGVEICSTGIDGLIEMPIWDEIEVVFDATSAKAHLYNFGKMEVFPEKKMVDLTPAAIGPYFVPAVNGNLELSNKLGLEVDLSGNNRVNVNMVTCGGQATIPMVAAVSRIAKVHYGEIVASIASKSAGPGTRANIDEFTGTTSAAIEKVGGATKGKAIIILNPAEPPLVMRDTVFTLSDQADREAIRDSISKMVADVQKYVPGYTLHQEVQFDDILEDRPVFIEGVGYKSGLKTTVLLQVVGAGHYLPEYAGNLDIMTSAALAVGEQLAR